MDSVSAWVRMERPGIVRKRGLPVWAGDNIMEKVATWLRVCPV